MLSPSKSDLFNQPQAIYNADGDQILDIPGRPSPRVLKRDRQSRRSDDLQPKVK